MRRPWIRSVVLATVVVAGPPGVGRARAAAEAAATPARSVYAIDPALDVTITGLGIAGVVLPALFAKQLISHHCPCDPAEVNAFDRSAIGNDNRVADGVSDVTLGLALLAPLAADALALHDRRVFYEDALVFAEALAVTGAVVTTFKYTVQRPLPRVYDGQDPVLASAPGGYRSFFSGHTALVFAALGSGSMTLGYRWGAWVAPWLATVVVGSSVGLERVAAGRHFYSDVIVGALAGSAVGIALPWLHHHLDTGPVRLTLRPVVGAGLAIAAGANL